MGRHFFALIRFVLQLNEGQLMPVYLNYSLENSISLSDRSIAYGDGLFETLSIVHGQISNLSDHILRLSLGCLKLGIPFDRTQQLKLHDFVVDLAKPFSCPHIIKIIVTRGEGGRGYLPNLNAVPSIIITTSVAPDYTQQRLFGVHLGVSSIPSGMNRYLAGMKHLNRLENVMAKGRLTEGCFEDVMLDDEGYLVECIQSNLFWIKDSVLYTPILDRSGVQGVMRSCVLKQYTDSQIVIGRYAVEDLQKADEIFITNSLMGVVPITNFLGRSLPIGINTRKIKNILND